MLETKFPAKENLLGVLGLDPDDATGLRWGGRKEEKGGGGQRWIVRDPSQQEEGRSVGGAEDSGGPKSFTDGGRGT